MTTGGAERPGRGVVAVRAAAERLAANADVLGALVAGVGVDQARWKPDPTQWSILEVVNHLADEEVEDFRRRVALTLENPGAPWPPIDPQVWAVARGYNQRELGESLARFLEERDASCAWLQGIAGDADLSRAHEHPTAGVLRAGDLLASWLAHDLIHIRQITRLHYRWLERGAASAGAPAYRLDYAGPF
jgi:hypothetical protein